jgi:tetratricopeptide (TPR) repeat protein
MFQGYDDPSGEELKELVNQYERLIQDYKSPFFDVEQYEQIIDFYLQNDQVDKACEVVDIALAQYPFATGLLLQQAHIKIYDNHLDDAIEIAERIILLEPYNPDSYVVMGNAYDEMGQYGLAIAQYEKALEMDSEKDEIYLYMAYSYENSDNYEQAIHVLQLALGHNPHNHQVMGELAFCCGFIAETASIERFLEQFIDQHPYEFMAWHCLGVVAINREDYDKALYCFDYATIINEQYIPAHLNMGNIYVLREEFYLAIDSFKKILELSPDDIFALCYLANCYRFLDNTRKSRELYKKALKVDSGFSLAWHGMGVTYQLDDNHKMAIEYIKKAIDIDKDDHSFWHSLGQSYHMEGHLDEAYEAFQRSLDLDAQNPEYVRSFAIYLLDCDMEKDAKGLVGDCLEENPANPDLHLLMAGMMLNQGMEHEAVFHLVESKDLNENAWDSFKDLFPHHHNHPLVCEIFNL